MEEFGTQCARVRRRNRTAELRAICTEYSRAKAPIPLAARPNRLVRHGLDDRVCPQR